MSSIEVNEINDELIDIINEADYNYHTLDNLIGHDGKKILPKGVRHITFYPEGYYYIDDNNEDELINRGDVHGGFLAKDYIEQKNIVNTAGKILSDIWFDDLTPMVNGYFRVSIDGKSNLMDIDGNLLLKVYERNLCDYIKGDVAFSFHDGFLFSNSPSGQTQNENSWYNNSSYMCLYSQPWP